MCPALVHGMTVREAITGRRPPAQRVGSQGACSHHMCLHGPNPLIVLLLNTPTLCSLVCFVRNGMINSAKVFCWSSGLCQPLAGDGLMAVANLLTIVCRHRTGSNSVCLSARNCRLRLGPSAGDLAAVQRSSGASLVSRSCAPSPQLPSAAPRPAVCGSFGSQHG